MKVIMTDITIREHEYLKITKSGGDHESLSEKQVAILRRIENTLPKGALSWGHNKVKFSQFCGVIQLGEIAVEVLPKIYGYESKTYVIREILIKMLYSAQRLIPKTSSVANIKLQKHHLLDVFIHHFCELLFEQIHKGLIRLYQNESNNLSVVRGKINIREHLKNNIAHKEKIYCDYDELKIDNEYNQAIKSTLVLLYSIAKNIRLKQKLNELIFVFAEVSNVNATSSMVKSLPRNRLVNRYTSIFQMCEWFLSGMSPDIYTGNLRSLSLLFDMNRIFESYITNQLKQISHHFQLKLREQGPQKYIAQEIDTGKNIFLMKPDISLLDNDGNPHVLLDTKWKLLDAKDNKYGVSQSDIYQMLAYANQYQCNDVVIIYPKHSGIEEITPEFKTIVGNVRVYIWTIDLAGIANFGLDIKEQLSDKLKAVLTKSDVN